MLWIRYDDRFNFDRALQALRRESSKDGLQIVGPLIEGTPVGEFRCYVNLPADNPAFNLFMKNHGVTIYSDPDKPVTLP